MNIELKEYKTKNNEMLLYTGDPDLKMLESLAEEAGDVWHSSLDQGFKNCFPDLIYQTSTYWWFLNDIENQSSCVNWRVNSNGFVVRKSIWESIGGLDNQFESITTSGLDFGYNLLRNFMGIPLYVKGLYKETNKSEIHISKKDRYRFFFKNFKNHHAFYMLIRKGVFRFLSEYNAYRSEKKRIKKRSDDIILPLKELEPIKGMPTVSLVIPTMKRQHFAQIVLQDHVKQSYLIKEAIIVDQTPVEERDDKYYRQEDFPFDVKVKWQLTKGSCLARNEAIDLCSGDYIIFADDDVRVPPEFVENHIRLLQTYNAGACNGLDIMAQNVNQDLSDLEARLDKLGDKRWKVGISSTFSNANSCVRKDIVEELGGNDINFDGGYGEDSDYGFRIIKNGHLLLNNPYSPNLHLKPPEGGYRWWGKESRKKGKKRKQQPWELDKPVKNLRPIPSPTVSYGIIKHFKKEQLREWKMKYFFMFLFKRNKQYFLLKLISLPKRLLQFSKSVKYAKALINLGPRYK